MTYEHNIRTYMFYRFFFGMLIIGPVLMPYLRWKGLSYTEIMWLQSISAFSVVLFEVPTGAIADKISRKLSLALSGACISMALTIYILTHSFYAFACAEALFGLGLTFGSGADSALLYESLDRLNRKDDYARIDGKTASYIFAGQGVGAIVSSLLYTLDPNLPFWISVGSAAIAAGFALRFFEPKREKSAHHYHIHVRNSLNIAIKTPRILWTVCLACLMGFAARVGFWLYEPYFTHVHIDVIWFGSIFFFFNMIAALSAKYLANRKYGHRKTLIFMGGLMAMSYIIPALLITPWAIAIIGLQQIVRGIYRPTLNSYINRQIHDDYRATVISIVSLSASLSFACFSPLLGMSLDYQGAIPTYAIIGIVTFTGIIALIFFRHIQRQKEQIQPISA